MVNARNAIYHGTTRLNGHPAHQHTFPTAHTSAPTDITIVNATLCSFTTQRVTTQNQMLPATMKATATRPIISVPRSHRYPWPYRPRAQVHQA